MEWWHALKYKNLSALFLSLIVALILSRLEAFHIFLLNLGDFGYIGAFFAGMLFVSTFTVATSAVVLLVLAERLSPFEIGIIAGLGAVIGDFAIFRFMKDNLMQEVKPLYDRFGGKHISVALRSKYFSWTLPLLGAFIIASPLPDEVGVSLLGISNMKSYQFLIISFLLNALGIFLIISASTFIKL